MPKLLYVPVTGEALEELCRQASAERRRPQDEAAIILERVLLKTSDGRLADRQRRCRRAGQRDAR